MCAVFQRPGSKKVDTAIKAEFFERGYNIFHDPRDGRGGGTAVV